MNYHQMRTFRDELEKVAATRQVKEMRKLVAAGELDKAKALAEKLESLGVLKKSKQGTNIGRLGHGAEAIADITVGASGVTKGSPLTARKVFDPKGAIYGTDILSERMQAGRKLRKHEWAPDFAGLRSKKMGKGGRGGRFLHYDLIDNAGPARIRDSTKAGLKTVLQNDAEKARQATAAGHPRTKSQVRSARDAKRAPLIKEFMRRGHGAEEAKKRAFEMIPEKGGARLGDLHPGNVRRTGRNRIKVVDYFAIPGHRKPDMDRAVRTLTGNLQRDKQLHSMMWRARLGTNTAASDMGIGKNRWGERTVSGLRQTPGAGAESSRVFSGLGPGSRQAKKVRGAKILHSTPLRDRLQAAAARQAERGVPLSRRIPLKLVAGGALAAGGLGLAGWAAKKHRGHRKAAGMPSRDPRVGVLHDVSVAF